MYEFEPTMYANSFFLLIIVLIFTILLVIQKINTNEMPKQAIRFYNAYFLSAVLGWLALWVKVLIGFESDLMPANVLYVIANFFLILAITTVAARKSHIKALAFVHAVFILGAFFLQVEHHRLLFFYIYAVCFFPLTTYIAYTYARDEANFGYMIIAAATFTMFAITPLCIYLVIGKQYYNAGYSFFMVTSAVTFLSVGVGFLTSVLIAKQNKLALLALIDPLTGLYNRRGMDVSLHGQLASNQGFVQTSAQNTVLQNTLNISAIMTDIDFFKAINDSHGHAFGDEALKKVADIVNMHARSSDVCCRLGGEEFLIMLPETTILQAAQVAERIRKSIENMSIPIGTEIVKLTASFGVASGNASMEIEALINITDKALYAAKAQGRNRVCTQ